MKDEATVLKSNFYIEIYEENFKHPLKIPYDLKTEAFVEASSEYVDSNLFKS